MFKQRRRLWIGGSIAVVVIVALSQLIITYSRPASKNQAADWGAYSLAGATSATATSPAPSNAQMAIINRVLARTNSYRALHGCPALRFNALLTQSAYGHSRDMALNDFSSHVGSDGSTPAQRIAATGYHYANWAENIAWSFPTPEAVVDAWYNETPPNDGHRRNILNCALVDLGVGYYYLADDPGKIQAHFYWTQDFSLPRS